MVARQNQRVNRPVAAVLGCVFAWAGHAAQAQPTSTAATRVSESSRVERVELSSGFYLLRRPEGYRHGDCPPLIICLHETETGAAAILEFWRRLKAPVGMLIAAPEHHMPGWREEDMPCLRALCGHLREHVTYDRQRILLTGYSAGGAMAMHLLYVEGFPATAVATTANYVPPSVTRELVAGRRDVPIFYAVGMKDINQDRMRASIELLEANSASLTLLRPDIGHCLDADVGQRAMDWFVATTAKQTRDRLDRAGEMGRAGRLADAMEIVQAIADQGAWHGPSEAARAGALLRELEVSGAERLARSEHLIREGRGPAAVEILRSVEADYGSSRLGREARKRLGDLRQDPGIRAAEDLRRAEEREEAARGMLVKAQRFAVNRRFEQAKRQCETLIKMYPDSTAAGRARTLLEQLRQASR